MKKILAILILLCLVSTACTQKQDVIKIGAILMLTGEGANQGENGRNGADLALEEINKEGGVLGKKLEIIYEDNQGDNPKVAVSALRKIVDIDQIKIIMGPQASPSGIAVAPIACQEGIMMVSPTLGMAEFNEACDYLFVMRPHDYILSEELAKKMYEKGYRKIAILGSQQAWEQEQAEHIKSKFEELGGQVVSYELPPTDGDLRGEALKIAASKPDAVALPIYFQKPDAAKRLREQGVKAPFYSVLIDNFMIKAAHGALEDTITVSDVTPSKEFVEKYEKRFNQDPDFGSDTAYDTVKLIAQAIKITGSTNASVLKDYLNNLKTYEGASGFLHFDGKGAVIKKPKFTVVKDGKITDYVD